MLTLAAMAPLKQRNSAACRKELTNRETKARDPSAVAKAMVGLWKPCDSHCMSKIAAVCKAASSSRDSASLRRKAYSLHVKYRVLNEVEVISFLQLS